MNLFSLCPSAIARSYLWRITLNLAALLAFVQLSGPVHAADPVTVGTRVTLTATAEGSPAPTFQWRKNGVNITGATGPTFIIAAATLADAGTYSVVATNIYGSASSPDEVLTVQDSSGASIAPSIATQPAASQTVAAGGTATFSVVATGSPAPTYQWRKDGVAISGATSASLTLPAVTTADGGNYTVVVANSAGSVTSNNAALTVTSTTTGGGGSGPVTTDTAPAITTQPAASQTVAAGGSASFSVAATGSPASTYQWRKDGVAISGATSASLTLPAVTTAESGNYTVVVTNSAGSVTSNNAALTVTSTTTSGGGSGFIATNTAPAITTQPAASQTIAVGSSASMSVIASGSPAPTYQWRRNGVNISGATSATYTIASVSSTDSASYNVVVTNSAGSVTSNNSLLTVQTADTAPVITTEPSPQFVPEGGTARFTVGVLAIPGATYQWRKNGVAIAGATSASLSLPSVSASDVGRYTVVATNAIGTTTSAEVPLVIATPPVITTQPLSQAVFAKANVTFTVAASGNPAPTFQWKKNGADIAGATGSSLVLKGVTRGDAGKYTVMVTNPAGWTLSSTATLMVENVTGKRDEEIIGAADPVASSDSQLVNLSVRATAGAGGDGLIVGFVVDGSANKQVLIRGVGPTLRDFGVIGALADPNLALYAGANLTAANDDWITNENALLIEGVSAGVGAFGLRERGADAALMTSLKPGAYTAQVSSKDASSGVALVEVYDTAAGTSGRLVNLSVRAQVGGESEAPNVGFVISGRTPKRVLIRAIGPTLRAFGVTDAIADPQLEIYRGGTRIEQNDNWGGGDVFNMIFNRVGAFALADPASRDAVLFTVLDPGAYTVVVTGANGSKGTGLVELYEVP